MKTIQPNARVVLEYTLKDEKGTDLDSSDAEDGEPIVYVHGYGMLVPGLESALMGLEIGSVKDVTVPPDEGFGDRDDELVLEIDRGDFPDPKKVAIGDEFFAESPDGDEVPMRVVEVKTDTVVVDANHPLAGVTLRYAVVVKEVAQATDEEIAEVRPGSTRLATTRRAATTPPTTTPTKATTTPTPRKPGISCSCRPRNHPETAPWPTFTRPCRVRLHTALRPAVDAAKRAPMTQKTNPWTFDVRVRERNLKAGTVTDKDVDKYIAGLPDLADHSESFATSQPALAPPPAAVVAEDDSALDDEDDEDEVDGDNEPSATPE